MQVASYLLARLAQLGVEHVFTVPGDYAGPFLKVLDADAAVTRVATVHELGAGYAADGYGRLGGVGAACVQYGVGTFSLLNCTAGSFVERVPVVVISASPKTSDRKLETEKKILFHHSTGDLRADQAVFAQVTVASEIVDDASAAAGQIDRALVAMLTHRRPIYLEVLNDVWAQDCGEPTGTLAPEPLPSKPEAVAAALDDTWARLEAAAHPVLWLGVEVARFDLGDVVQKLVDVSGIPFTTTSLGKTVLDESQPAFIGTFAGPASPDRTRALMAKADCVVALGTIITDDYLNIMGDDYTELVVVTDEYARLGEKYYEDVGFEPFVVGLLERYDARGGAPRPLPAPDPAPPPAPAEPGDGLTYNRFMAELEPHLGDGVVLVLGESTSLYVLGNLFGLPRDSFVAQTAWGSLGHETGAALGVALASGKRPFVVAGDGGFRMVCQELSSLATARCNAVVFVMSNDVYAIEQAFVDISAFKTGDFDGFDVLPPWDHLALATAFGAEGRRATTVGELREVLAGLAAVTDRPVLVEVVIPKTDLAPQLERLATTPPPESKSAWV